MMGRVLINLTNMLNKSQNVWFMVASDHATNFKWEHILNDQSTTFWWIRRFPKNFKLAKGGDLILCYRSSNKERGLVGLAEVEDGFNEDGITVRGLISFKQMIPYDYFKNHPTYKNTEAGRHRNRGTLFSVNKQYVSFIWRELELLGDQLAAKKLSSFLSQN